MQAFLERFWRDKLDIIFPRGCVHCGGVVEGGEFRHLCALCEKLLFMVAAALHDLRTPLFWGDGDQPALPALRGAGAGVFGRERPRFCCKGERDGRWCMR